VPVNRGWPSGAFSGKLPLWRQK